MAIDTPARLAILGAGPIGIEAALYARFLGYDVVVYEQGQVADGVLKCAHLRLLAPFSELCSPLGMAALQAQDESFSPPAPDAILTARQWANQYVVPLAQTDLIIDHVRTGVTVMAVGKEELLKTDTPGHEDRGDWSFRVLSRGAGGDEHCELFDGVLDCTGRREPNWLGHGGIPALGEIALRERILDGTPDIEGRERTRFAGRHTLVVGAGLAAATNIAALARVAQADAGTRVTWITRREGPAGAGGPLAIDGANPDSPPVALARDANRIAAHGGPVTYWPRTVVECIAAQGDRLRVELAGEHPGSIEVDEVIASVGYRPNLALARELEIQYDYATEAAAALRHPEPNYYILGSKSAGRGRHFTFADGLSQIREVFAILGDRPTLDLYAGATKLPR